MAVAMAEQLALSVGCVRPAASLPDLAHPTAKFTRRSRSSGNLAHRSDRSGPIVLDPGQVRLCAAFSRQSKAAPDTRRSGPKSPQPFPGTHNS